MKRASAKSLRQKWAWCVQGKSRKPEWRKLKANRNVRRRDQRRGSDHLCLCRPYVKTPGFVLSEMENLWRVSYERVTGFNLGLKRTNWDLVNKQMNMEPDLRRRIAASINGNLIWKREAFISTPSKPSTLGWRICNRFPSRPHKPGFWMAKDPFIYH